MVSEVKESSDFWTIFDLFLGLFWTVYAFMNKFPVIYDQNSAYFKDFRVIFGQI